MPCLLRHATNLTAAAVHARHVMTWPWYTDGQAMGCHGHVMAGAMACLLRATECQGHAMPWASLLGVAEY